MKFTPFLSLSLLLPSALSLSLSLSQSQSPFSSHPPSSTFLPPTSSYHPTSISSTIDLGGALTKSNTVFKLVHDGSKDHDWVVGVKGREGSVEVKERGKELESTRLGRTDSGITYYSINVAPSNDGQPTTLSFNTVTSHQTVPFPASLPQTADVVTMLWTSDLTDIVAGLSDAEKEFVSEIKIKVKAPSPRLQVLKSPAGFDLAHTKGGATATFTSNSQLALESAPQVAKVQYVHQEPIATIRKLDRTLEVSHWGANLAVMDEILLTNTGPKLEGHFSRLEHQKRAMQRRASAISINTLSIVLPPRVTSPYYYDIVGNVSTSRFRPSASSFAPGSARLPSQKKGASNSLLEITPRYPVLGGWNYTFTVGYDAPLEEYLKKGKEGGTYVLAVPFLTPIKEVAVDDVTVTIRLPEGAKITKVHTPFAVDSLSLPTRPPTLFGTEEGYTKTYLDSTGGPTVVLRKSYCTDRHGGEVIIEYSLSPFAEYLQKPLVIATVLSSFFVFATLVRRMEWGIGKQ